MKCLGLSKAIIPQSFVGSIAVALVLSTACKSDGASSDGDGAGGDGGDSRGGNGGSQGGSGGEAGGAGGGSPDAGVDSGLPTPPPPDLEDYAPPTGVLPVTISFKTADDLTKNFAVVGDLTQSSDSDGVLKVVKGQAAAITYDTKPDKERTDTFESFTVTIKFRSEQPAHLWVSFATDRNRNDGQNVGFNLQNNRPGPVGVSDVDNIFYNSKCWAVSLVGRGPQCVDEAESYGWTVMEPSMKVQTVKLTIKADKTAKTIRGRGEFIDDTGEVIDGSVYDWADLNRVNGEVTFGFGAPDSDVFIDEVAIKAAEPIADPGIVRLDEGDAHMHVWVPTNLGPTDKIKGLIITAPDLSQPPNGLGDFALFEHLRKFATAHGWALLGGVRGGPNEFKDFFKQDLAKLATKANRPEMNTVPVFIHHLLNLFSLQALSDPDFAKRVIGFLADKVKSGGDLNAGMPERLDDYPQNEIGRAVPGFITYSFSSQITRKNSASIQGMWYQNRFFEKTPMSGLTDGFALWAYTAHGAQTNAVVDSWMLYLALLQEMIKQRTTNNDGTTPLKPVDKNLGYMGYSEADQFASMQNVPKLESFTVKGFDKAPSISDQLTKDQPDFIPGPATGLVWQAFDYYRPATITDANGKKSIVFDPKKVFWITAPKHGKPGDSRLLKLGFDASLTGWKKIEFFDASGDKPTIPVTVVLPGGATEWEYKNLTAGAHSFIAKVTAADDKIHITHPAMAIFAP